MSDDGQIRTTGIDDFRELREEGYYYIDKTLMIRDFLSYKDKVSLITRPRRFGKTLNMTMIRDFFDINEDGSDIFSELAIMKTEYANQMNSRPVVYLSFKDCSGADLEELKVNLALVVKDEYFKQIAIMRESKKVDWEDDQYFEFHHIYKAFRKLVDVENKDENKSKERKIDNVTLKRSLLILTRTLTYFYSQKPLLLIDEYDGPLINAHEEGFREKFSKRIYADFLGSALKGSTYLHQALLTGIQRVAKESIFSKLNNFSVYTVVDNKYAHYFGFTEDETKKALADHGMIYDEDVKRHYDGYHIGGCDIYNPWSILNYVDRKQLRPYWANTSSNGLIKEVIPKAGKGFHVNFERLILDKEIRVSSNLETAFVELATPQTLWGLLVNAGYLTVSKIFPSGATRVKIPNEEVKKEFREIVATYTRVQTNQLEDLFNALIDVEMEEFLRLYQGLVYDYVSYHDVKDGEKTSSKHLENSYHMLFLGMSISVSGLYEITSNLEAGRGRGDIIMESLQPELRPHIIVELKEGDNARKLKQEALEQIFEKKYYVKLKGRVLCVGLAHSMKECKLVYEEIVVNEYGEIEREYF